jgi:hypothetical protein
LDPALEGANVVENLPSIRGVREHLRFGREHVAQARLRSLDASACHGLTPEVRTDEQVWVRQLPTDAAQPPKRLIRNRELVGERGDKKPCRRAGRDRQRSLDLSSGQKPTCYATIR